MATYKLKAAVRHISTDVMTVEIQAANEVEAFERASRALEAYPNIPAGLGKKIPRIYVDERTLEASEVVGIRPYRAEFDDLD